jgi:WD40 repeat protein
MATSPQLQTIDTPYVGPQPFEEKNRSIFFGRTREINDLSSLVVAHGEVLLYAQSGAGKTSLLNAGLIPRLKVKGFQVRRPVRVSGQLASDIKSEDIANLYIFNVLRTWVDCPADWRALASETLGDFLGLPLKAPENLDFSQAPFEDSPETPDPRESGEVPSSKRQTPHSVLIFDQLEEIFEYYPERRADRGKFFKQVGEALQRDAHLRVVFAIREDYLAQLIPFLSLLPEGMKTRFRLERLQQASALEAIKGPLTKLPEPRRYFAPGAAEALALELLKSRGVSAEGLPVEVPGEYVEPVQLQVVCTNLWRNLPPNEQEITQDSLQHFGDVNEALSKFYEDCINHAVASVDGLTEGTVRRWFNDMLITPANTRGSVYRGPEKTGGLANAAVDDLEDSHIIRKEQRAGASWYELTHDRFIAPIQKSNQEWLLRRGPALELKLRLERQAQDWVSSGRAKARLLGSSQLAEAERWLNSPDAVELGYSADLAAMVSQSRLDHNQEEVKRAEAKARSEEVRAEEQRQLAEAQRLLAQQAQTLAEERRLAAQRAEALAETERLRAEEQTRAARKSRILAWVAGGFAFLMLAAVWYAFHQRQEARASKEAAMSSLALLSGQPDLALLLAREAYHISPTLEVRRNLLRSLTGNRYLMCFLRGRDPARAVNFSPDGETMVAAGCQKLAEDATGRSCAAYSLQLWNVKTRLPLGDALAQNLGDLGVFGFSRGGKILVASGCDEFAGAPDHHTCRRGVVHLWEAGTWQQRGEPLTYASEKGAGISALDFSADDRLAAGGADDGTVIIWDTETRRQVRTLPALRGSNCKDAAGKPVICPVMGVAFSHDGKTLVSATLDGLVGVWNPANGQPLGPPQRITKLDVAGLVCSPTGTTMALLTRGGAPVFWHLEDGKPLIKAASLAVPDNEEVLSLDITAEGTTIATGGCVKRTEGAEVALQMPLTKHVSALRMAPAECGQGIVRLWDGQTGSLRNELGTFDIPVEWVGFTWRGDLLASVVDDGSIAFFDTAGHTTLSHMQRIELPSDKGSRPYLYGVATAQSGVVAFGGCSASGKQGACTQGKVNVWDLSKAQVAYSLGAYSDWVTSVAFSRDGETLASGGRDGTVLLWQTRDWARRGPPLKQQSYVSALAFSPDRKTLASGGCLDPRSGSCDHGVIHLWDAFAHRELGEPIQLHNSAVYSLAFRDGRTLISSGRDGIKVTDLVTRRVRPTRFSASQFALSPDGKLLASSSRSRSIALWDYETEDMLGELTGADYTNGLAFSADSKELISLEPGGLTFWDLSVTSWLESACRMAGRNLTPEEWHQNFGDEPYHRTCQKLP